MEIMPKFKILSAINILSTLLLFYWWNSTFSLISEPIVSNILIYTFISIICIFILISNVIYLKNYSFGVPLVYLSSWINIVIPCILLFSHVFHAAKSPEIIFSTINALYFTVLFYLGLLNIILLRKEFSELIPIPKNDLMFVPYALFILLVYLIDIIYRIYFVFMTDAPHSIMWASYVFDIFGVCPLLLITVFGFWKNIKLGWLTLFGSGMFLLTIGLLRITMMFGTNEFYLPYNVFSVLSIAISFLIFSNLSLKKDSPNS